MSLFDLFVIARLAFLWLTILHLLTGYLRKLRIAGGLMERGMGNKAGPWLSSACWSWVAIWFLTSLAVWLTIGALS